MPAGAEQLHHGTHFGVIRLVLIQLQKFGKHFVNNPRPGRLMLSQSGFIVAGDFSQPYEPLMLVIFNAGNLRMLCSRGSCPPRFAEEGEEGEAEALGNF